MSRPTPGHAITMRVAAPAGFNATSELTAAAASAGAEITALDVIESTHQSLVVDITCNTSDEQHAGRVSAAVDALSGVQVRKVSDRTFLMHLGGKLSVESKVELRNRDDLSRAYTPGVARVCLAIAANPADARRLTIKRNTVAVVTDGTAVLGLGDIGPAAALPVMEGKAALFKRFADVDAWPVCLDTKDTEEIIMIVKALAPVYGGINLEDIAAPRCFEIERRLRDELDIPVFHDDQHGTAIVVLAALINALRVVGKNMTSVKIVVSGAGAAGHAIVQLLHAQGAGNIIACSRTGAIHRGETYADEHRQWIADNTNPEDFSGSLRGRAGGRRRLHRRLGAQPADRRGRRPDGGRRGRAGPGQPGPGDPPGGGGEARHRGGHRAQRLPEPDQQRAGLPRPVPRPARRGGQRHHHPDAGGGRRSHRELRGRGRAQRQLHRAQRVRPARRPRGRRRGRRHRHRRRHLLISCRKDNDCDARTDRSPARRPRRGDPHPGGPRLRRGPAPPVRRPA